MAGYLKPLLAVLILLGAPWSVAEEAREDPLGSFMWERYRERFLGDTPVRFDSRVGIQAPAFAEDSGQVPIDVDASDFNGRFQRMLLWVELNPIPLVFDYRPLSDGLGRLSINVRLEQSSAVRVAVLSDGVWHVGSTRIEGEGGGCTTPGIAKTEDNWSKDFGRIKARRFGHESGSRVRVKLSHPMDSGLIPSTRPFYVEQVAFVHGDEPVASMTWQASVSENPELALTLKGDAGTAYRFQARDNNGNEFDHVIP
ncbi:sulfur oxidation protein SoxZ [Alloalcanivorax dieselolei B5]|uniref:Sulfur oxidation protein SoxZ n=2 Tax=Alcanivoracaceae TaxID=224372 RepID=K0CEB3_ALCDB|nr:MULTISPECIES: quinoprotein dehydrogenase-associated SoxYZ-like carrier [Alcanivoracaceae]AFT69921.1 sulfur oxidation protein SoxZ [Alloalcanivorax dieselolei B5]KAF0806202.1 hypothetical protein A6D6_01782 [Alcanivorax xiamenensis]GGJ87940.1 hypothetical protein GCM10007426_16540 [Alloalcanivorax dieselolei]